MENASSSQEDQYLDEHRHIYAVNVGRVSGIYSSWLDCYAQIRSWSGGSAWAHTSIREGLQALHNANQRDILLKPRMRYICDANLAGNSFPPCVDEKPYENALLEYDICAWVLQITNNLSMIKPVYEVLSSIQKDHTTYYRYKVSTFDYVEGKLMPSVGKFATTHELAQQLASIGILRRLQVIFRKVIIDFNYHNIKILEKHIALLNDRLNYLQSNPNLTSTKITEMLHFTDSKDDGEFLFVDEDIFTNPLLQFSMQSWLRQFAGGRRVETPTYTLQKRITHNGIRFYRYYVAFNFHVIGRPPVSMGRFASTHELAREDAALAMLRRIQSSMGRSIVDFNFYQINSLENEVARLMCLICRHIHETLNP